VVLRDLALAEAIPTVLRPTWVTSLWFGLAGLIAQDIVTGYTITSQLDLKIIVLPKLERTLSMEQRAEVPYQAIMTLNIIYPLKMNGTKRLITRVVVLMLDTGLMLPRIILIQRSLLLTVWVMDQLVLIIVALLLIHHQHQQLLQPSL